MRSASLSTVVALMIVSVCAWTIEAEAASCGKATSSEYRYRLSKSGPATCREVRRVFRRYVTGQRTSTTVGGFPGYRVGRWTCSGFAGGFSCSSKRSRFTATTYAQV